MRLLFVALTLAACASSEPSLDGGSSDSATGEDAGTIEDASTSQDAGALDASGFGVISGSCGELDDELTSASPYVVANSIDFGTDGYDDADLDRLTEGGREIIRDGNAGGSSLLSEVFSYEVLERCEGAVLLKTETEVEYVDSMGKLTDLLVSIDGLKIGVSVTRAVTFPRDAPYTAAQAQALLEDKLMDILASSANVSPSDRWVKQILHVIAYGPLHAEAMLAGYQSIDAAVRSDTILIVTQSDGEDEFLY